jgi:hypothetical protein
MLHIDQFAGDSELDVGDLDSDGLELLKDPQADQDTD